MVGREAEHRSGVDRHREDRVIDEGRLVDRMRWVEGCRMLADLAAGIPTAAAGCTSFSVGPSLCERVLSGHVRMQGGRMMPTWTGSLE